MNQCQAVLATLAMFLCCLPAVADEREEGTAIRQLIVGGQTDEAAERLMAARKTYPESTSLATLGNSLASFYAREGKLAEAQRETQLTVDYLLAMPEKPAIAALLRSALNSNVLFAQQLGEVEPALALYDRSIAAFAPEAPAYRDLQTAKIVMLARVERGDEAQALLDPLIANARLAYEAKPEDPKPRMELSGLLTVRADMNGFLNSPALDSLAEATHLLSDAWVLENAADPACVAKYIGVQQDFINYASRHAPQDALERIEGLQQTLTTLKGQVDNPRIAALVEPAERSLSSLKRRAAAALKHETLIGEKAMPVMPESWVNGAPLSPVDLQGKVVLVDFWAVWCGPCIATFPHLREWQQTYADQGLVILGVTEYYSYDWDEDQQRSKRIDEISHEAERAAMEKFAAHHELEHRFAVMDDGGELKRFYGVTGIPQAVLIDRNGRVRMIKVGSGDANATALHDMIEKLLAEK